MYTAIYIYVHKETKRSVKDRVVSGAISVLKPVPLHSLNLRNVDKAIISMGVEAVPMNWRHLHSIFLFLGRIIYTDKFKRGAR